jgi:hypothetical protein
MAMHNLNEMLSNQPSVAAVRDKKSLEVLILISAGTSLGSPTRWAEGPEGGGDVQSHLWRARQLRRGLR